MLAVLITAIFVAALCAVLKSHVHSQFQDAVAGWNFNQTGGPSTTLHITGSGSGRVFTLTQDATRSPDGTRFQITFNPGGTTVDTGCEINTSQNTAIPGGTTSIDVIVTNNCVGNPPPAGANWVVYVGP